MNIPYSLERRKLCYIDLEHPPRNCGSAPRRFALELTRAHPWVFLRVGVKATPIAIIVGAIVVVVTAGE